MFVIGLGIFYQHLVISIVAVSPTVAADAVGSEMNINTVPGFEPGKTINYDCCCGLLVDDHSYRFPHSSQLKGRSKKIDFDLCNVFKKEQTI